MSSANSLASDWIYSERSFCRAIREVGQVLRLKERLITQVHLKNTPPQALQPVFDPQNMS